MASYVRITPKLNEHMIRRILHSASKYIYFLIIFGDL